LPKSLPAAYEMMPPQQTETFQMREKETTNRREIRSPIKKKKEQQTSDLVSYQ
jgi:hypothetical protein